ncbi:hypothetical protein [Chitinophaga nivalis]|uniref:Helitron helicase-like domain-containing protein n=1 Tax=Chitinophaga nivalis TaxID=2991709 RepID=A0ABT3IFU9_9BACT|nr:hypothetical protein [Chitinophaga nivalis]MCW3467628.1 hypothetical protein [Chitinophaga nivalis]MCW3482680.1 hypothetical protein [Chitinophaga nivalis]
MKNSMKEAMPGPTNCRRFADNCHQTCGRCHTIKPVYPTIDEMVSGPAFNSTTYVTANPGRMSKNGIIVYDSIPTYLDREGISAATLREPGRDHHTQEKSHFRMAYFSYLAFTQPDLLRHPVVAPDYPVHTTTGMIHMIRFYEMTNQTAARDCSQDNPQALQNYLDTLMADCPYLVITTAEQPFLELLQQHYLNGDHDMIRNIMKGAAPPASFYSKDPETGLAVKIRTDSFNLEENIGVNAIISFLTTEAPSLDQYMNETVHNAYALQEAMRQEVATLVTNRTFHITIMIMIQTVPPYLPAVFWRDPADLFTGRHQYRSGLEKAREQAKNNISLYPPTCRQ